MLNRDVKQFGKKFMFDANEETCWNSDQVTLVPFLIQKYIYKIKIHILQQISWLTMVTVLGRIPVGCFGVPTASKSDGAATTISRRIFGKNLQVRRFLSTLLETFLSDQTFKTNLP